MKGCCMAVMKIWRGVLAVALVLLLVASIALAAKPKKGKTYIGQTKEKAAQSISFTVSKNGKSVTKLNAPIEQKCVGPVGGFGGINVKAPKSIKITSKGTFKVVVKFVGITGNKKYGKETVTGKFLKGGKEKGTIKSKPKILKNCHGETVKYSTVASTIVTPKPI